MGFRLWAHNEPTFNAGLPDSFVIFQGILTNNAMEPYCSEISQGVFGPLTPTASGSGHVELLRSETEACGINYRVKSGNFGHQVNSDIHLHTVEIQMRRLLKSRLGSLRAVSSGFSLCA